MRFNTLFLLLVLSCFCVVWAQGSYDDCCLSYVSGPNRHIQKHAKTYRLQKMDGGCNIRATIFTMRKGREYCTDTDATWVKELMAKIDRRLKISHRRSPRKSFQHQHQHNGA
ncbi:C-C motif chemokine 25 [Synchiropus splendidus]|uniref:C-C motif chemokine 25 n=1 Tax=Synchiropus splendidus TaxID=270530 RepID=UPI00237DB70D|nr:C-C motif chemokine 25 [Synchiropus splendidus]XP_053740403.1 C-C motif chemokine 25 [Synchiropus splendidus]